MILNLLRVEELRVEDMIKRSFAENFGQRDTRENEAALESATTQLDAIGAAAECHRCTDIDEYYEVSQQVGILTMLTIHSQPRSPFVLFTFAFAHMKSTLVCAGAGPYARRAKWYCCVRAEVPHHWPCRCNQLGYSSQRSCRHSSCRAINLSRGTAEPRPEWCGHLEALQRACAR